MREDLIEISRTVDAGVLGGRIRSARLRAGLTQAQVAADRMSVAYVSRIEAGQRRPDPALLEAIAERVARPVEELLLGVGPDHLAELRVRLDHAQLSLATGAAADALVGASELLEERSLADLPDLRRQASYVVAGAHEALGDVQAAIIALEDLAEAPPYDLTWLGGMTALSRCYRESGDLGRAVAVGERAGRFVEEHDLAGVGEAVRLSLTVAAAHFERGDVQHAARMCQRAIQRAEELDSPVAKASAYWNASIIESKRGDAAAALPLAQRAMSLLEASDEARNIARLRTQLGILQLRMDPPDPAAALVHLERARLELGASEATPADLADNSLAQARARFLLGDDDRARRQAEETAVAARETAPLVAADALVLRGQIAAQADDLATARSRYQEAILLLTGLGADRSAAQLWFELGRLLEEVGETGPALDAYRRAAASTGLVTVGPSRPVTRQNS